MFYRQPRGIAWKEEISQILVSREVWGKVSSTEWNRLPLTYSWTWWCPAHKLVCSVSQTYSTTDFFFLMGYSLLLVVQRTHIRKCWLGPIAHYRWGNWFSQGLAQNHIGRWYPSRELGPRSSALRPTTGPRLLPVTHRNPEHQRESRVLSCTSVRHGDISPYCLQDPHPQPSLSCCFLVPHFPGFNPTNAGTSAAGEQELQVSGLTWHRATLQPAVLSLVWALRDISWDKMAATKFTKGWTVLHFHVD